MGSDLKIFMSCYETLTCLTHRKNNNNNRYVRGIKTRLGLTTKMFFLEIILERFMILYLKANVSRKFIVNSSILGQIKDYLILILTFKFHTFLYIT